MKLVVATRNLKKGGEMVRILSELVGDRYKVVTLADYPEFPEPEETGDSYAKNALIKTSAAVVATGELCIADDAGLEIDALGGEPGVHSKRFAGEESPFEEKISIILDRTSGLEEKLRTARFRCAVAVASPAIPPRIFESTLEGLITSEQRGEGGFGYDPIFLIPALGKTFAELAPGEKNAISHRGLVLRKAARYLNEINQAGAEGINKSNL